MQFTSFIEETIDGKTVENQFTVEFHYQPREPMTCDDPGCEPEVWITSVTRICPDKPILHGREIVANLSKELESRLNDECWEYVGEAKTAAADRRAAEREDAILMRDYANNILRGPWY